MIEDDEELQRHFLLEQLWLRMKYERSEDDRLIFESIWMSVHSQSPAPQWAVSALALKWAEFKWSRIKSFGDLFSITPNSSQKVNQSRMVFYSDGYYPVRTVIWMMMRSGEAISDSLFEEIGEQVNQSGSTVKSWWYDWQNEGTDEPSPELEEMFEAFDEFQSMSLKELEASVYEFADYPTVALLDNE